MKRDEAGMLLSKASFHWHIQTWNEQISLCILLSVSFGVRMLPRLLGFVKSSVKTKIAIYSKLGLPLKEGNF